MTGPEHFREAERLLAVAKDELRDAVTAPGMQEHGQHMLQAQLAQDRAQVHATLAQVVYLREIGDQLDRRAPSARAIDVVFDGPPSHESGRFVEVEDMDGRGVSVGRWIDRGDGMWALRIPLAPESPEPGLCPHGSLPCAICLHQEIANRMQATS